MSWRTDCFHVLRLAPGRRRWALIGVALSLLGLGSRGALAAESPPHPSPALASPDRSPVDLVLTPDGTRLLTVNQGANSVSLVDIAQGRVLDETPCGSRPCHVALTPDGRRALVTASYSGELLVFDLAGDRLQRAATLAVGHEPRGVAIAPDGKQAYVALSAASAVAVVDLERLELAERVAVGRWPRQLALSPDGSRLAVGCSGSGGVSVVDTAARKQLYFEEFIGLNLEQMQTSADGRYVYFPWIIYRNNPITDENIRRGWVLASRIARVKLDGPARREAIALDPRGQAVGDPHGLALSPDERTLVCAAAGTHELLVYRLPDLPFQDYGGPGDHVDAEVLKDRQRFDRIPLGGRPLNVRYAPQGDVVYVANYLLNAVQVVDVSNRKVVRTIELGSAAEPALVRRGEAIFHDATRSLDQWYSCHSCHYEGDTNAVAMDTRNDGRFGNFKTVLSLRGAADTAPWFWHGWAEDFPEALRKSLTDTMLGPPASDDDVAALAAYLHSLEPAPNPNLEAGALSAAAERGRTIFESEKAGCARCHPAPRFTSQATHDVGLGSSSDAYPEYNAPSLRGAYSRVRLLHDGSASSVEEVLARKHSPQRVTGLGGLTPEELRDLVAYVESL